MSRAAPRMTLVGAGLTGSLLALHLAQAGYAVDVFERRPDPRQDGFRGGRSINLALSERGQRPLREAGMEQAILGRAVMMRGRMIHDHDGHTELQRYGIDDNEVNWSVSRATLNIQLLDAAEDAGANFHFDQTLVDASFGREVTLQLRDEDGVLRSQSCRHVLGCDGAGSALRSAMHRIAPLGLRTEPLRHGYKELEIPSASAGLETLFESRFAMEPRALHIWPRGGYMCIGLPNDNGSFTVTLFLPLQGSEPSFSALTCAQQARQLFTREFADALPLMPGFDEDFQTHPVGELATLYVDRWNHGAQALLLGDAAHAIVPFHGQGMNAGFEDVDLLMQRLRECAGDPGQVIESFTVERKADADAIAEMALENYIEMRDSVADPHYLLKRTLASQLAARCPQHFMPRYRMVTFTHLPYRECLQRGQSQNALLESLLAGRDKLQDFDMDKAVQITRQTLAHFGPTA